MAKAKRRKRKPWSARKYWTEYFSSHSDLWINGHKTISHALAAIYIPSPHDNFETKKQESKAVEKFAKFLDTGRLDAIKKLREAKIPIFVIGHTRIEGITKNKLYQEESLRRICQQRDQKEIATFVAAMAHSPTDHQIAEFGIPTTRRIQVAQQRLLIAVGGKQPCPCGSGQKYKRCCRPKDKNLTPNQ